MELRVHICTIIIMLGGSVGRHAKLMIPDAMHCILFFYFDCLTPISRVDSSRVYQNPPYHFSHAENGVGNRCSTNLWASENAKGWCAHLNLYMWKTCRFSCYLFMKSANKIIIYFRETSTSTSLVVVANHAIYFLASTIADTHTHTRE